VKPRTALWVFSALFCACALLAWFAPPAKCPWQPDFQCSRNDAQPATSKEPPRG